MFRSLEQLGFQIETRNHADAILTQDFRDASEDLIKVLSAFRITRADILKSGGGHAQLTMRLRDALYSKGWQKHIFVAETVIDGRQLISKTHEIDHIKRTPAGTVALEIEWNNKDPFFDRDLENFHRLHAQSAISIGVMITRGSDLQEALVGIVQSLIQDEGVIDLSELESWGVKERTARQKKNLDLLLDQQVPFAEAFARSFVSDKYGQATTHWAKLRDRIDRGVGNPCPLLSIGLPVQIVEDYSAATPEL